MSYDQDMPPISVRLPNALLEKVDALVALCNATQRGRRATRATMLGTLVTLGLQELEKHAP
jgi:Arc/MetJ-type ribon-helix-helix transcriptional regulator